MNAEHVGLLLMSVSATEHSWRVWGVGGKERKSETVAASGDERRSEGQPETLTSRAVC